MRTIVVVAVMLIGLAAFCALVVRVASAQSKIGLGGKDVRVPLEWLEDGAPQRPTRSGDYGRRLTVGGQARFFELHVPPGYDPAKPAPLVLVFHGGGSYPAAVRYESRMDEVADKHGFLVVYPAGTTTSRLFKDRFLTWNDGRALADGSPNPVDDVAYVRALLADVRERFNIDPRRVYLAGYSNGAQFSYRLIKELPHQFAAVAAVAGQRGPHELVPPPPGPLSVMQISGQLDPLAPFQGGSPPGEVAFRTVLKPVPEVVKSWVKFDGLPADAPQQRTVGQATESRYGPGASGAEVILWTLADGGHTWPGGQVLPALVDRLGPVNQDIWAAAEMWAFFSRHELPAQGAGSGAERR